MRFKCIHARIPVKVLVHILLLNSKLFTHVEQTTSHIDGNTYKNVSIWRKEKTLMLSQHSKNNNMELTDV